MSARPRGFMFDWNPKPETMVLIGQVEAVLHEYREHLPLTVRQIFYRLVGAYDYPKDERAYARLCEHLVKARRARMIPFSAIRDDGTTELGSSGYGYADPQHFWKTIAESAERYFVRRHEGQPKRVELWCEAAGMAPMLARVAADYDVKTYSTGGFSSVSVTHEIAQRVAGRDVPTVFLHVGDYDPSGQSIFDAMTEDADAFTNWAEVPNEFGEDVRLFQPIRVALTGEQVDEYGFETAPPKRSDSRSRNWAGETCQLEAVPPDVLSAMVREAIEEHVDLEIRSEVLEREERERDEIRSRLDEILGDEEEE